MSVIQIGPVVEEVLNMMRSILPTTIDIRRDISASHEHIRGDITQIHQVLVNLCTNAGYAMRETGGSLELNLEKVKLDQETARNLNLKAHHKTDRKN